MIRMSKFVGCLAALAVCATAMSAEFGAQLTDSQKAEIYSQAGATIPAQPYAGILHPHSEVLAPTSASTGGPQAQGVDVLGRLFGGTDYAFGVFSTGMNSTVWENVFLNNDGSIQTVAPVPGDPTMAVLTTATNLNWVDEFGYDTYFQVCIDFDGDTDMVTVTVGGILLVLEDGEGNPIPNPHGLLSNASDTINFLGLSATNALLNTPAYVDDIAITVGGVPLMMNGLEVADGVMKGPLDDQPAGPLDMGEPTTVWNVAGTAPITFVSGNAPRTGDQSIEFARNGAAGFVNGAVQGPVDNTLAPAGADASVCAWFRISDGGGTGASDIMTPSVDCRQIGTVADPDDVGETCCEFEWTYSNTSVAPNIVNGITGGFIAIEAGNGGPCSNDGPAQIDDDIDFFFGDIDFCNSGTGGSGWSTQGPNTRVVLDLGGLDLDAGDQVTGRIRLKTHTGASISLPDGTMVADGQVLAAGSIFIPGAFGGPDPDMAEGLDCQSQFGPHMNNVYDVLWFDTVIWQWRPLLPVPALSFGGKMLLFVGVGLVGVILIARSRKTATA